MNINEVWYNEQHKVIFTVGENTYDSWDDLRLIPLNKPTIESPDDNMNQIPVKYSSYVDDTINGFDTQGDMKGEQDFIIVSDTPDAVYTAVKSRLHCKFGSMRFSDYGNEIYAAFKVTGFKAEDHYSSLTIEYIAVDYQSTVPYMIFYVGENDEFNTWNHWHLLPTTRIVIDPPSDISKWIEVTYADGSKRKLGTSLGSRLNGTREGTVTFVVVSANPDQVYNDICNTIHNKTGNLGLSNYSGTFTGVFTVESYKTDDRFAEITIGYNVSESDQGDIVNPSHITPEMAHYVDFNIVGPRKHGQHNTWTSWGLISEIPLHVPAPSVRTTYIEIPGADGALDMSEAVSGDINFGNSEGTFKFVICNDNAPPVGIYNDIMNAIHGQRGTMTLYDVNATYSGRFNVSDLSESDGEFYVEIGFTVAPATSVIGGAIPYTKRDDSGGSSGTYTPSESPSGDPVQYDIDIDPDAEPEVIRPGDSGGKYIYALTPPIKLINAAYIPPEVYIDSVGDITKKIHLGKIFPIEGQTTVDGFYACIRNGYPSGFNAKVYRNNAFVKDIYVPGFMDNDTLTCNGSDVNITHSGYKSIFVPGTVDDEIWLLTNEGENVAPDIEVVYSDSCLMTDFFMDTSGSIVSEPVSVGSSEYKHLSKYSAYHGMVLWCTGINRLANATEKNRDPRAVDSTVRCPCGICISKIDAASARLAYYNYSGGSPVITETTISYNDEIYYVCCAWTNANDTGLPSSTPARDISALNKMTVTHRHKYAGIRAYNGTGSSVPSYCVLDAFPDMIDIWNDIHAIDPTL